MKSFCAYGYTIFMHRNFDLGRVSFLMYKVIVLFESSLSWNDSA